MLETCWRERGEERLTTPAREFEAADLLWLPPAARGRGVARAPLNALS